MARPHSTKRRDAAKARYLNRRFGRLIVTAYTDGFLRTPARVECICDCGNRIITDAPSVAKGHATSCGCKRLDSITIHGHANVGRISPEYRTWKAMIQRCTNPRVLDYPRYGGRGIKVCEQWRESFERFLHDTGPRPSIRHTLDRYPNKNGHYEPGNCRWATVDEQSHNRSDNIWVSYKGRRLILADWRHELQLPVTTFYRWYRNGIWPPPDPFGLP